MTDAEKTPADTTPAAPEPTPAPVEEAPKPPKPLKDYKRGDLIDVVRQGDWVEGFVQTVEKDLNMVYTHTDRGPVTVGNPNNIRPRQG